MPVGLGSTTVAANDLTGLSDLLASTNHVLQVQLSSFQPWFGLVWFGVVWFGLVWLACVILLPVTTMFLRRDFFIQHIKTKPN